MIPATIEGQNGAVNKENIKLAITGCPPPQGGQRSREEAQAARGWAQKKK